MIHFEVLICRIGFLRPWVQLLTLNCCNWEWNGLDLSSTLLWWGVRKWNSFHFWCIRKGKMRGWPCSPSPPHNVAWRVLAGFISHCSTQSSSAAGLFLICVLSFISWNESLAALSSLSGLEIRAGVGISEIWSFLTCPQIPAPSLQVFKARSDVFWVLRKIRVGCCALLVAA